MTFRETVLKDSYIIGLEPSEDDRGWFVRTYCKNEFSNIGHHKEWMQINHSFTKNKGTVRGMHYQLPPYGEIKLVRCIAGTVYDVIVDLRKGSDTYLQWLGTELSAENKEMIYIPEGFAHGFQALSNHCELMYHHSQLYTPEAEKGIKYNDPRLRIKWPLDVNHVSERDAGHEYLNENFKGI